jgi:hypothetical protein
MAFEYFFIISPISFFEGRKTRKCWSPFLHQFVCAGGKMSFVKADEEHFEVSPKQVGGGERERKEWVVGQVI